MKDARIRFAHISCTCFAFLKCVKREKMNNIHYTNLNIIYD